MRLSALRCQYLASDVMIRLHLAAQDFCKTQDLDSPNSRSLRPDMPKLQETIHTAGHQLHAIGQKGDAENCAAVTLERANCPGQGVSAERNYVANYIYIHTHILQVSIYIMYIYI